jgi:hypothetical protein
MGRDSPPNVAVTGYWRPRGGPINVVVGALIATSVACGARTGLDLGPNSTALDDGNIGASRDGGRALDSMPELIGEPGGDSRPPCSSYTTFRECIANGCGACVGAVGMRNQTFICYEPNEGHGCVDGPGGIHLIP